MSLTSFLKSSADVRERLKSDFLMPPLGNTRELLAPPLSKGSLVGNAFDYLLRFYIERLNPKAIASEWIAEKAALCDIEFDDCTVCLPDIVTEARENHAAYLKTGEIGDKLLRSVLCLGQLEVVHRRGLLHGGDDSYFRTIGTIDPNDVQDLRRLISLVQPEMFRTTKACLLNPGFGRAASELVGGADCDLVIDDALIDIKTVKEFELKREYFNQLIGYYVLSKIGGIQKAPKGHQIKKLGIYFARHGHLWLFDVSAIIQEKQLSDFIGWFKKRAIQGV
jgi:hypothetical protein